MNPIYRRSMWAEYGAEIHGFSHVNGPGLFDSYVSALADYMGLWDEYVEHHRAKRPLISTAQFLASVRKNEKQDRKSRVKATKP